MLAFGERVELEAGMIILLLAAHRQKLTADWIRLCARPIDQRQRVWIEPDRHGAPAQPGLDLGENVRRNDAIEGGLELRRPRDGVAVLPDVLRELAAGNIFPELEFRPLGIHRPCFLIYAFLPMQALQRIVTTKRIV